MAAFSVPQGQSVSLQGGWTLSSADGSYTLPATVPSTICGTLWQQGVLPANVLDEQHFFDIDKNLFAQDWTYTCKFKVDDFSSKRHYRLRFNGLGYRADIRLNGTLIAARDTTEGPFMVYDFDVTGLLKKSNVLAVTLEQFASGGLNLGFVDWNPPAPDESMGIVREVELFATGEVAMQDLYVRSKLNKDYTQASLEVRATARNLSDKAVSSMLEGTIGDIRFTVPVTLDAGQEKELCLTPETVPELLIDNPRLWWSCDLGNPEMYRLDLRLLSGKTCLDAVGTDFGIREMQCKLDQYGHRAFYLNGKKLLLMGGGWTDDLFLRDTPESNELQVQKVVDMGLNCIRFEGIFGKDSSIYDLCDRYGILSLLGFSCQWEWESKCKMPHDDKYGCILSQESIDLATRYFVCQAKWLRNHPSVVGFLTGSDRIPKPELEERYVAENSKLTDWVLVCSAAKLTSTVTGPSGNKMLGPYEYVGPEYWYEDQKYGGAYGFNTETGIGLNMPQLPSVKRMIGEKDLWPTGGTWNRHCTRGNVAMGTPMLMKEIVAGQYGEATTIEQFVARAQSVDYEGTRAMFEAFRVKREITTGLIQWMLNSAWPSLYWQLYDHYGAPTAGYYGVKKGMAPLQVIYNYADGNLYAVNSTAQGQDCEIHFQIYDAASHEIASEIAHVYVPACQALAVRSLKPWTGVDCFVFTKIKAGRKSYDNIYALPEKGNVHAWDKTTWYYTPISSYADLRFVTQLPKADIELIEAPGGYLVKNNGKTVAWQIILERILPDGSLDADAFWSDNFFALAPGATRLVTCRPGPGTVQFHCGL